MNSYHFLLRVDPQNYILQLRLAQIWLWSLWLQISPLCFGWRESLQQTRFYPNFVTISTGEIERKFTSRNMTGRAGPWGLQHQFSPANAASVGQPPRQVRWDFTRAISAPKDHRIISISQTSSKLLSMDWGLREILQETIDFLIKYGVFLQNFP